MAEELVVVYAAAGQAEAALIKSLLEAAEIPAMIAQEGAGAAYGFTVGLLGRAEILVPEAHVEEALALLAAMERGELESDSDS